MFRFTSRTDRAVSLRAALTCLVLATGFAGAALAPAAHAAVTCTPTGYVKDGIDLTAAVINPGSVSGPVDATGCNIGVYFSAAGSATNVTVSGAPNYFGVLVNGAAVTTSGSTVSHIGETPHNGSQHGVAIAYLAGASGSISGNTVADYQKGGITVSGAGSSATVSGNTVTGVGPVGYIAQNGIQVSFGATGTVTDNSISGNAYTGPDTIACGLLMYQAEGVKQQKNSFSDNQKNVCSYGRGGGNVSAS